MTEIIHRNVFDFPWPLEDGSVQAIVTSPPYWGIRKYDIPDVPIGSWRGQYGLESKLEMYLEHTMLWISEAFRVLADDGLFFLNLGDTYGGSWGAYSDGGSNHGSNGFERSDAKEDGTRDTPVQSRERKKCKLMVPARVAIAAIEAGWLLRNEIVWFKPNGIPDSIKDRFTRRWESVYLFSKSLRYYSNLDAVRVPYKPDSYRRFAAGFDKTGVPGEAMPDGRAHTPRSYKMSPKGANPGDVWKISAGRAPGLSHYSVWPEQLVERAVKFSTRPGDIVLDPFCGSGTTLFVAVSLGRDARGFDLGYKDVQRERLGIFYKHLGGSKC